MEYKNQEFNLAAEVIDENQYSDCKFTNCTLIYRGGSLPTLTGCHLDNCRWQFEEHAMRTLVLLRRLYHGLGPAGPELIESTFNEIRSPLPK